MHYMKIFITVVLVSCSVISYGEPKGASGPPELFSRLRIQGAPVGVGREVVRSNAVDVRFEVLRNLGSGRRCKLNLIDEVEFTGIVDRVERRGDNRFSVFGVLDGMPNSVFIFVVEEDVAVGVVNVPSLSEMYRVRYIGDGVHLISETDSALYSVSADDVVLTEASEEQVDMRPTVGNQPVLRGAGDCVPPQTAFDSLVVYSHIARQAAGGTNAIIAECQLAVDLCNQAYINSGIDAHMRMVFCDEVAYDENGTLSEHLNRLKEPADGILDFVHDWRNYYGADFVTMYVDDSDGGTAGGVGYGGADSTKAFSIVSWGTVDINNFAHEIGHNLGCAHDREHVVSYSGYYPYSFGWRFTGDSSTVHRTVMAYPPGDMSHHFSNPDILFDGQPTGVPIGTELEAHNAMTINNRKSACENFRFTKYELWVDFSSQTSELGSYMEPFRTLTGAVGALVTGFNASEMPSIWIKGGSSSETLTISKPMVLNSCGGDAVIGE